MTENNVTLSGQGAVEEHDDVAMIAILTQVGTRPNMTLTVARM